MTKSETTNTTLARIDERLKNIMTEQMQTNAHLKMLNGQVAKNTEHRIMDDQYRQTIIEPLVKEVNTNTKERLKLVGAMGVIMIIVQIFFTYILPLIK